MVIELSKKRKFTVVIAIEVESENYVDVVLQSGNATKSALAVFNCSGNDSKILAINVNPNEGLVKPNA